MSQSTMAIPAVDDVGSPTERVRNIAKEQSIQELLDLLDDPDCRAVLAVTSETALTAREVSEASGLPRSTTYRKLDSLTDAGLLEERIRIGRSGQHPSEYLRIATDVRVSIDPSGEMELQVSYTETSGHTQPPAMELGG